MIDAIYTTPATAPGLIVLPDALTPFVDVELAGGMVGAHRSVFGTDLERRALCCLLAQIKFETGNGKFCHLRNVGNVKGQPSYRGYVTYFRCNEIEQGKVVWYDPFNPACCFRAFLDWAAGLEQHLRFLGTATNSSHRPNRYAAAWDAAMRGDIVGFVEELHRAGYFTAALSPYLQGCRSIFERLLQQLPSAFPDAADHVPAPETLQPTAGHSPFSDTDLERVRALHFDLAVDWQSWQADRDHLIQSAEAWT